MVAPTSDLPKTASKLFCYIIITLPSISIAYSTDMKKSCENLKAILTNIQYDNHNCRICGDFNDVAMLTGLQLGYAKICCFLSLWTFRARTEHHVRKDWPMKLSKENTSSATTFEK